MSRRGPMTGASLLLGASVIRLIYSVEENAFGWCVREGSARLAEGLNLAKAINLTGIWGESTTSAPAST